MENEMIAYNKATLPLRSTTKRFITDILNQCGFTSCYRIYSHSQDADSLVVTESTTQRPNSHEAEKLRRIFETLTEEGFLQFKPSTVNVVTQFGMKSFSLSTLPAITITSINPELIKTVMTDNLQKPMLAKEQTLDPVDDSLALKERRVNASVASLQAASCRFQYAGKKRSFEHEDGLEVKRRKEDILGESTPLPRPMR